MSSLRRRIECLEDALPDRPDDEGCGYTLTPDEAEATFDVLEAACGPECLGELLPILAGEVGGDEHLAG